MTGKTDWISDGNIVVRLDNGHQLLADITGSGCVVGTCVAIFCAAAASLAKKGEETGGDNDRMLVRGDMLLGAIGGYDDSHIFGSG